MHWSNGKLRNMSLLLLIAALLGACSRRSSRCDDELLENFESTRLASGAVALMMGYYTNALFASVDSMEWRISTRGSDGCTVALVTVSNGIEYIEPVFYISLDEGRIYADDETATVMARSGPPEWLDIEVPE